MTTKAPKGKAPDISELALKDLLVLQDRVGKAIVSARETERAALKAKMTTLAEEHGFSVAEIWGRGERKKPKSVGVAKYANPDDKSQTWTGRGRMPFWLADLLTAGGNKKDFEI